MSDTASSKSIWTTLLAVIGAFAIFVLILVVTYLPRQAEPIQADDSVKTPAQRQAILAEHHGKEITAATTYGWVDQSKGVVRLPIDRAVELTIGELNAKK